MRWEAALSLERDDRCDYQIKDPEEHAVIADETRPRQLYGGASQGLRESDMEARRPAERIGGDGRSFTQGCHFSDSG